MSGIAAGEASLLALSFSSSQVGADRLASLSWLYQSRMASMAQYQRMVSSRLSRGGADSRVALAMATQYWYSRSCRCRGCSVSSHCQAQPEWLYSYWHYS